MSLDVTSHIVAGQEALREMRAADAIAAFSRATTLDPDNIVANLGLYEAYQINGDRTQALEHQLRALAQQRLFLDQPAPPGAPTVLLAATPGDWQANVPIEFLYGALPFGFLKFYVFDNETPPEARRLPPFDIAFNLVAHSERSGPTLDLLEKWLPTLDRPFLNSPARVQRLSRDGVARDFADLEDAFVPATQRVRRANIAVTAPVVIRPVGSQAGAAFSRVETAAELDAYLAATSGDEFYVMPFVDYRLKDGYFRKYRIIFVGGVPYPQHLAISQNWMVHYYNALNAQEQWIRDEEERFLADIANVFDGPRRRALDEIARRVGLDYFGIDCSVLDDGRVLIFEIDPAMIVHVRDPIELYPYKHKYVPRIPAALEKLIRSVGA
jgi:glutathione synthase/RimK-type ligase-like ATP-grasp enzyme